MVLFSLIPATAYAVGGEHEQDYQAIDAIIKVKSEDAVRLGIEVDAVVYRHEYFTVKQYNRFYDGGNRDHLIGGEIDLPAIFGRIKGGK